MTTNDNRPCFIYAITHKKSGRRYVGSCLNPTRRWIEHRSDLKCGRHHCDYLQRAWDKYGKDTFVFSILERLETNDSVGRAKAELTAIAQTKCYNSRTANLGLTNFVNSPATRAKINAGLIKLASNETYRAWLQERGKQLAAHARTPERRAIRAQLTKELWKNPKHRKSVSKKLATHWKRDGVRKEHSERVKKHRGTPEARQKNSEIMKAIWSDPNSGLRNRKQTRWADPKAREIKSAQMRELWAKRRREKKEKLDQL